MANARRQQAVVIGGSMAGLLAARVLADFFEKVLIVERDVLPRGDEQRRGVPQGHHAHAILSSGLQVTEELFPGITAEMVTAGAPEADPANDGTWFFEGANLKRVSSATNSVISSRPFLESRVRRRVVELENVVVWDTQSVQELLWDEGRVIGLSTERGRVVADLVVDASGRGSQVPKWLEATGFRKPPEEKVEVDLVYTSRLFRRRDGDPKGDAFRVVAPTPEGKRGGVILAQEGGRWILTLYGYFGRRAPEDLDGFLDYAKSLPSRDLYDMVRDAEPIGPGQCFRFPASTRRRYEMLKEFPAGLLVFGDALCSFDPIFGQGMSSAALQAVALRRALRGKSKNVAKAFFADAAKVVDGPWSIAVGSDLKMPETAGPRSALVKFINWYMTRLHRAAHNDPIATLAFIRVAQLLDPPTAILRPKVAWRVLLGNIWRKGPTLQTETKFDPLISGQWASGKDRA
jgi:2-polyprenyl-6-methoxyphenol hydroxylase-like FAD-dependent oxidoreductase